MAVLVEAPLNDPRKPTASYSETETEMHAAFDVCMTLTGDDALPINIMPSARAAIRAACPFGSTWPVLYGGASMPVRLKVVGHDVERAPANDQDLAVFCFATVRLSSRCENAIVYWWTPAAENMRTDRDSANNTFPTAGERADVPYSPMEFHYRRLEPAVNWGPASGGAASSDTTDPMRRRVKWCKDRTNSALFLGDTSRTWLMQAPTVEPLTSGDWLVTYHFVHHNFEYGSSGVYERWGYRDSAGTERHVLATAAFATILELTWPIEDGGGLL